jgi:hypothetical protein
MNLQTTSTELNPVADPLYFSAKDVTASQQLQLSEVDGYRSAGEVAETVAAEMELPEDVPYSLRDNSNARMLVDDVALGSQIQPGADLVLIPRSHLG